MVIVAKELTDDDRDRLNRGVERVIQKSDRDEMLQQLSREVAKCIAFEIGSTGNGRNPIFNGSREAACATSRHFVAIQQFSRFRSEADIQRAALTEPDL